MNDDEDVKLWKRKHVPSISRPNDGFQYCAFDEDRWPCLTARYIALLDEIGKQTAIADAFRKGGPAAVEEVRAQLGAQIESLQVENAGLRAALRFYAEDDSYYSSKAADGGYDIPVLVDSGWKAKEALGDKKGLDEICVWKDGVWTHSAACGRGP